MTGRLPRPIWSPNQSPALMAGPLSAQGATVTSVIMLLLTR